MPFAAIGINQGRCSPPPRKAETKAGGKILYSPFKPRERSGTCCVYPWHECAQVEVLMPPYYGGFVVGGYVCEPNPDRGEWRIATLMRREYTTPPARRKWTLIAHHPAAHLRPTGHFLAPRIKSLKSRVAAQLNTLVVNSYKKKKKKKTNAKGRRHHN